MGVVELADRAHWFGWSEPIASWTIRAGARGSANTEIAINYSQDRSYSNAARPRSPVDYHFPRGNPEDQPKPSENHSLVRHRSAPAKSCNGARGHPQATGGRVPQRRVTVAETRSTHA